MAPPTRPVGSPPLICMAPPLVAPPTHVADEGVEEGGGALVAHPPLQLLLPPETPGLGEGKRGQGPQKITGTPKYPKTTQGPRKMTENPPKYPKNQTGTPKQTGNPKNHPKTDREPPKISKTRQGTLKNIQKLHRDPKTRQGTPQKYPKNQTGTPKNIFGDSLGFLGFLRGFFFGGILWVL